MEAEFLHLFLTFLDKNLLIYIFVSITVHWNVFTTPYKYLGRALITQKS